MKRTVMALAMMGSLLCGGLEAQERAQEGERIRIDHHAAGGGESETMEGWLVRIHPGDSIVMATRVEREKVSFRIQLVDRVRVHRIKSWAIRGAWIGAVGGALVALPFTSAECSDTRDTVCFGRGAVLYGVAGGLLVGGVIGGFIEVPKWVDVAPQSFRGPSFRPGVTFDGGLGVSAKLTLRY